MADDYEALYFKKREVEEMALAAANRIAGAKPEDARSMVEGFVSLTAPEEPEVMMEMITMASFGRGGGRSRKPGNVFLNWRKLIDVVPDATIAGAGVATSPPWLWFMIALYVFNKVWRGAEEPIDEVGASIVFALWHHRNGEDRISEDNGFSRVNEMRTREGMRPLTRVEFDVAVNHLLKIECIEIEDGMIWMYEHVWIEY